MKNTKNTHTPGPWEATEARVYQNFTVCGQPSSRLICSCHTHSDYTPWTEQNANARLIAAAPDLLAALKLIYANAGESPEWIRARIGSVISKAEGVK